MSAVFGKPLVSPETGLTAMTSRDSFARNATHFFHGARVLKRARRKFTSAVISASDICGPRAGIDRPSAPVGGLMPFRITCIKLSGTGA